MHDAASERELADANRDDAPVQAGELAGELLRAGFYVGRYRIVDVLGTGGIGVVYAAIDEDLNRTVALKLVRPTSSNLRKAERRRARLIREAQALARLSHPNVVPVYEVGRFEDRVYLAMEYIEGSTLRRWQQQTRPSCAELIAIYIQAGRGLAAAHGADIIHRDFKPDNVLVGSDGRVRVLDFGLATPVPDVFATGRYATVPLTPVSVDRRTGPQGLSPSLSPSLSESAAALVTAHGKVMGTPAYMAPEQARGEAIDPRADQYSFCVALWEALFGARPQRPVEQATTRIRWQRRLGESAALGHEAPHAVLRAIERGLSSDPAARFPSMDALLEALEQRGRGRRAWIAGGLAAVALSAGLGLALFPRERAELCPREREALTEVWDARLREKARLRITASARPYATATWETIDRELERWSQRWLDARQDNCVATRTQTTPAAQSEQLFALRQACLERQRSELEAVTQALAHDPLALGQGIDAELESALQIVLRLPDPSACAAERLAEAQARADDPLIEHQRRELAHARGLLELGKFSQGLARVDTLLAALGHDSPASAPARDELETQARLLRAEFLLGVGREDDALIDLRSAAFDAQSRGHDELVVRAATELARVLAAREAHAQAHDWLAIARASLTHLGSAPELESRLFEVGAEAALARGEPTRALALQLELLALHEGAHAEGEEPLVLADLLIRVATTQRELGQYPAALARLTRAMALLRGELGDAHPALAHATLELAALAHARGDLDGALARRLEALAGFERAYTPEHAQLATTYALVAETHAQLTDFEAAAIAFSRAYAQEQRTLAPTDPRLGLRLLDIAAMQLANADEGAALRSLEQASALAASANSPRLRAELETLRAEQLVAANRVDAAIERATLAREAWRGASADHPGHASAGLARATSLLARAQLGRGQLALALALEREALASLRELDNPAPAALIDHLAWIAGAELALEHHQAARAATDEVNQLREGLRGILPARTAAKLALVHAELAWRDERPIEARASARAGLRVLERDPYRGAVLRAELLAWVSRHANAG